MNDGRGKKRKEDAPGARMRQHEGAVSLLTGDEEVTTSNVSFNQ